MPPQGKSSGIIYNPGGGGGPNTSIALAGTNSIPDATPTDLVFDTVEASANLVAGVPTVPSNGDYWVNASCYYTSTGFAGGVQFTVNGSTYGDIDTDLLPPSAASTEGTMSVTRRVTLTAGEQLTAYVTGSTGAAGTAGGSVVTTFLQFWAA
jgi:hypothetical protein